MRLTLSIISPLAAVVFSATAFSPAAAQHVVSTGYVSPVAEHAAVSKDASPARTVAVYQFAAPRSAGMPAEVTLADSVGQLVATFRLPGARGSGTMMVEVLNNDLVLQGDTPSGVLTLVLSNQAAPDAGHEFVGRWSLGDRAGELRGRATR